LIRYVTINPLVITAKAVMTPASSHFRRAEGVDSYDYFNYFNYFCFILWRLRNSTYFKYV